VNTDTRKQIAAIIGADYTAQKTLPEQITALETGVLRLDTENKSLRDEIATLKAGQKTANERAVEIAASVGITPAVLKDTNTGTTARMETPAQSPLEAVEAMYREKYELGNPKVRE
jgi:hypothetical protein